MNGALITPGQALPAPSTDQLLAVLSGPHDRSWPRSPIVAMERAPCPYGSSWWLEEIALHLEDNSRITLIFKNLVREADGSRARWVKPAFVIDPAREPWVYRNLLPEAAHGPPRLWAALNDFAGGRHWLFLERLNGELLAQAGDSEAWCSAARWLGHFHATAPISHPLSGPLLRHDHEYHRRWLARALSAALEDARKGPDAPGAANDRLARLRALVPSHERAIAVALATRPSLIHGEFYPSNVIVEQRGSAVHPFDWEMAALGPPLLDLAALISGRWGTDDRIAMTNAYREGVHGAGARCAALDEFMRSVAACQLLMAVQWLGWAAGWPAPADHRNDWLDEAERCAQELR